MAMEMHVFSERQLNSMAEWQRAVDIEAIRSSSRLMHDLKLRTDYCHAGCASVKRVSNVITTTRSARCRTTDEKISTADGNTRWAYGGGATSRNCRRPG